MTASAEDFRQWAMRQPGALVSGGPVRADFDRGWGHAPFMGRNKAHYWRRSGHELEDGSYGLRSVCGRRTVATPRVPLLEPGNLPYCVTCENRLMKENAR